MKEEKYLKSNHNYYHNQFVKQLLSYTMERWNAGTVFSKVFF